MVIKGTGNNTRLEEGICEQFAYLLDLVVYPKSADMNELYDMAGEVMHERYKK